MIRLTTEQAQQIEEALDICQEKFYAMKSTGVIDMLPMQAVIAVQALATIRAARAQEQSEQEPTVSDGVCGGCAKKAADGWALYCVECWEKAEQPVSQEYQDHLVNQSFDWAAMAAKHQFMEGYRIGLAEMREKCAVICEAKQSYSAMHANTEFAAVIRSINFEGDTGFRPVSEMIAEHKQDQKKAAAIEKAKMRKAEQEPLMDYERINALREGEQNGAEDAYFFVRPENDTPTLRKMFCQGFERGFHKGLKYASPVQQVDLTDDEIMDLVRDECIDMRWPSTPLFIARAVIAADREKNK